MQTRAADVVKRPVSDAGAETPEPGQARGCNGEVYKRAGGEIEG